MNPALPATEPLTVTVQPARANVHVTLAIIPVDQQRQPAAAGSRQQTRARLH